MNADDRLLQARTNLIFDNPFFGTLLFRMKAIETQQVDTAATDGTNLFYNPKFIESLEAPTVKTVLAHEVMHCVLLHMVRRGGRDLQKWNYAADFAVNLILNDEGFFIPPNILLNHDYAGMTAEAIYDLLPDGESGEQGDYQPFGEVLDGEGVEEMTATEIENEWRTATVQAARAAKAQGMLSGNIASLVEGILEPKVNWKEALARFVTSKTKGDSNWNRPNRRHIGDGMYLPINEKPSLGTLAIVIDTSGSVNNDELIQFISEVNSVIDTASPELVHVIYADSCVNHQQDFTASDYPIKAEVVGRGGTDFRPAIKHIEENLHVAAAVYLTDLEGPFPDSPPSFPMLWVCNQKPPRDVPFGELVAMV